MRTPLIALLSAALSATAFCAPVEPNNAAEAAYIAYVSAWKARDVASLDKLIASDYMALGGDNKVGSKATELREAKNDSSYDQMEVTEVHSLIVGETAVVSGITVVAGKDPAGKPYSVKVRFLATLLRREGHWQLVADQSAPAG